MYIAIVLLLMLVLAGASILIDVMSASHPPLSVALAGQWFVFCAVGVRLLLAGARRIMQPRFTAETILGICSADAPGGA